MKQQTNGKDSYRNLWLAGLGAFEQGRQMADAQLDKLQASGKAQFAQLVERGEAEQAKLGENNLVARWFRKPAQQIKAHLAPGQQRLADSIERLDQVMTQLQSVLDSELAQVESQPEKVAEAKTRNTAQDASQAKQSSADAAKTSQAAQQTQAAVTSSADSTIAEKSTEKSMAANKPTASKAAAAARPSRATKSAPRAAKGTES
ncbi:hypothetical protein [Bowmanella yangjiangensis]|uniref:Phasin family protein n=1 Tax=Bowmanella yangjiangensis TaxID=2811230 RepID=A0ABS3CRD0_9ALTE|nr:hypothetical protein [Bowmanella yangjiangensis]MBN7818996.1 hypothetical protein [Bowmanella yangjiangensis]